WGQLFVECVDDLELLAQPLGAEPMCNRQSGRVVSEGDVVMAQVPRRRGHHIDRATAVRPVRMGVAVALQQRPDLRARAFVGIWREVLEADEIRRPLTGECLYDHALGLLADPRQVA